jgi:hypothetical protein
MRLEQSIIDLVVKYLQDGSTSKRGIAREIFGKDSKESTVRHIEKKYFSPVDLTVEKSYLEGVQSDYTKAKILVLDIETAPILGHVWSLWNNNLGLNQIDTDWYILSFTAKWAHEGEEDVIYMDKRETFDNEDDTEMLKVLWDLLNEADFVLGQNIRKFDMKKINARFILNGFPKPSTYRQIDTLLIAKSLFGFTSNKLEYMTDKLCKKYKKKKHLKFPGHTLWSECLKGNIEAWDEMKEYNIFDVLSNQELYEVFMPWDAKLPNFDLYVDEELDMSEWVEDGFHMTNLGKYQRYRHVVTGQQRRGRENLLSPEKRKSLLANIVD